MSKLHPAAVDAYAQDFARLVCDSFFGQKTVASGKEILNFTPVGQVNSFVVSALFEKWKADAQGFKSPYFDFEQLEVKNALQVFMNTVSQHIAVKRRDLEPLLSDAVRQTLHLTFDPRHFFDDFFRNQPNFTLSKEAANALLKYTQINKYVPKGILNQMEAKEFVYANQAVTWLNEIIDQKAPENTEPVVSKFSEIMALNPALLTKRVAAVVPVAVEAPEPVVSFFDLSHDSPNGFMAEEAPAPPMTMPERQMVGEVPANTAPESLNDVLRNTHKVDEVETVNRQPLENIVRGIPMYQKIMFIHQLFSGNTAAYEAAITELDRVESYGQARDLIQYKYASQYLWDMTGDTVSELMELVKRRFA